MCLEELVTSGIYFWHCSSNKQRYSYQFWWQIHRPYVDVAAEDAPTGFIRVVHLEKKITEIVYTTWHGNANILKSGISQPREIGDLWVSLLKINSMNCTRSLLDVATSIAWGELTAAKATQANNYTCEHSSMTSVRGYTDTTIHIVMVQLRGDKVLSAFTNNCFQFQPMVDTLDVVVSPVLWYPAVVTYYTTHM